MKQLASGWDAPRIIRLVAGIGFGIYAIVAAEYMLLIITGLLLMQALLNISCCGAGGCTSTYSQPEQKEVYKGEIKKYRG